MAIIYTYPNLPLSSLSAEDLLVITNVDATNNNPTRSVTLADIATYVTGTGSGTGTTNKIVKFTDGANGLLGDSIMTESTGLIDLAGQFVSTSSPTLTQGAPVSGIKAILNGTTAAPNVALYGESKHTGGTQADSNYGLFAKGEFEGTGGFTGFVIGGNLEGRYDGTGTNGANANVYGSYNLARSTSAANGVIDYHVGHLSVSKIESANVTANNLQGAHTSVDLTNGTAGDVIVQILDFDGTGGTVTGDLSYLQIQNDTMPTVAGTKRAINSLSVLPSLFTGQVEIPLVPTINAHATSKQYVDQQISSVVSGLVFISTWDARTQAEGGLAGDAGNPDLSAPAKKVVGHYYVVSTAGSATPNGAGTEPSSWNVGDWCIYVEQGATDRWEKLDQTFVSGAGAAGQVTYWNSQNEVAGDNDLFFDSTNKRLGIGTTSPSAKLHISGADSTSSAIRQSRVGTVIWDQAIDSNGRLQWGTRATEGGTRTLRLELDDTGDVTIFPRATVASSGSGILYFKNVDDTSATINGGSIRTVDSTNNPSGADMRFQVANDSGTLFDAVTIDSNGFMGIGTTAPDYYLDVSTSARINSSLSNGVQLVIDNSNTTDAGTETSELRFRHYRSYVAGQNDAGSVIVGKEEAWDAAGDRNSYMSFGTRAGTAGVTEKMRITSAGNVGIGTTSPTANLEVISTLNQQHLYVQGGYAEGTGALARIKTTGNGNVLLLESATTSDSREILEVKNTNGTVFLVRGDGNVGIGTTSPGEKFTVEGDGSYMEITHPTATSFSGIKFSEGGTPQGSIQSIGSTFATTARRDNFEIFHNTGGNLTLQHSGGNVGIGTANPLLNLQINSALNSNSTIAYSENDTLKWYTRHNASDDSFQIVDVPNTLTPLQIASGGDVSLEKTSGSVFNLRRNDTSVVAGDNLGSIFFQGNDPSNPYKSGVAILGQGDGTWNMGSPNVYPSRLVFQTAEQNILKTAMVIKSDQKVGIGTTTPSYTLVVSDNGGSGIEFIPQTTNNRTTLLSYNRSGSAYSTFDFDASDIHFNISGSEKMRIDAGGNVGIGTTSPSAGAKLEVIGKGDQLGSTGFYVNSSFKDDNNVGVFICHDDTVNNTGAIAGINQLSFITYGSSWGERMKITGSGNVGIGTNSPEVLLHLSSTSPSIYLEDTDATNTYNITRINGAGGNLSFDTRRSSDGAFVSTDYQIVKDTSGANYQRWLTQGSERMRITSVGHVLVGGTAIQAVGAVTFDKSSVGFTITNNVTSSAVNNHEFQVYRFNSTQIGSITMTGTTGTAYNTSSDYRLKKDLKDFDGLDKVSKIPVYDFKWKVDDSSSYGVMAHELQDVLPDAVSGEKDGEEMQGVDYSKIVPLLIKSIQELEAKVKILENK